MSAAPSRTCPGCHSTVTTQHCPSCGERLLQAHDLTLTRLLTHVFQSVSSLDGKLLRTFRSLVMRPGQLTVAYLDGPRKPYISPFQFFLIVNVLFFAMQSFTGTPIFSTHLQSHMYGQDWSQIAQQLVAARLQTLHMTLETFAPLFDQAVGVNAKSLVILMVLPFALVLWALFGSSGRPLVTHVILSLHFYAALLLFCCVLLAGVFVDGWSGHAWTKSTSADRLLFAALLLASATYLFIATTVTYAATGWRRGLKVFVLTLAVAMGVLGYRFLVFLITLYTTGPASGA